MRQSFRIVDAEVLAGQQAVAPPALLDPAAVTFSLAQGRLTYRALLEVEQRPPTPWLGQGADPALAPFWQWWCALHEPGQFLPAGRVDLSDLLVLGHWGLVLDPASGLCLTGATLNWWDRQVPEYLAAILPPEWELRVSADGREFDCLLPPRVPEAPDRILLMHSPGSDGFGHWLLDHLPRLQLLELMGEPPDIPLALPRREAWLPPMLRAFGHDPDAVRLLPLAPAMRFRRAAMPSGTRQGFRVSGPVCRLAWRRLRAALLREKPAEQPADLPRGRRLFVSRRGLTGSFAEARSFANAERIETLAAARGYTVIRPEGLSLPAQARCFAEARVVVGPDGSGLHNILYAHPGAALGVIAQPERVNLWHAAFCQELGHRIGFLLTSAGEPESRVVEEAAFHALLDELEAAAD
ncbi:MAG: glycosyltransferase 61 family protein [Rhodovarius sp.]|nr:glycosyltransferase 61 family protein [Rhodovarius sp.]